MKLQHLSVLLLAVVGSSFVKGDNLKCVQCGPSMKNLFSSWGSSILSGLQSAFGDSKDSELEKMRKDLQQQSKEGCTTGWPEPTECSSADKYCGKITMEVKEGDWQAIRFCSPQKYDEGCDENSKKCYYICSSDGCNGAQGVSRDSVVVALALSVAMLLARI